MDRDAFLTRVRQAAHAGRAYSVEIKPFAETTGYVGLREGENPCERLAEEIRDVGGEAIIVSSLEAAREQLRTWLVAADAKRAFCWQHPVLEATGVTEVLSTLGIASINHDELAPLPLATQREQILACDVGITSTVLAIAETGSLWLHAEPGQERLASLAPPRHIAIVKRSQIVPDLLDAFASLAKQGYENLPSNITLVTGPSKTGDIELRLTTGVHGPGKWQVIVVDEPT